MIQQVFLHRVPVEPGDGAQPAGDCGASTAPGFQLPGEGLDVGTPDGERGYGTGRGTSR